LRSIPLDRRSLGIVGAAAARSGADTARTISRPLGMLIVRP
jgi:hypothetical protein